MAKNKSSTRYMSDLQEKAVSKAIDGKRTWNSGAGAFDKCDVVTHAFSCECKTAMTAKTAFSIKQDWLEKLKEQSFSGKRNHWALVFNFGGEENQNKNYYIISEEDFIRLKELIEYEDCGI